MLKRKACGLSSVEVTMQKGSGASRRPGLFDMPECKNCIYKG